MSFLIDASARNPHLSADGVPADMQKLVEHLRNCHECGTNFAIAELAARRHVAQVEAETREKQQQGGGSP